MISVGLWKMRCGGLSMCRLCSRVCSIGMLWWLVGMRLFLRKLWLSCLCSVCFGFGEFVSVL